MIPEDTYILGLTHKAIRALGAERAVLAKTIGEMCEHSESGACEISQEYLIGITGYEKRTLQRYLYNLRIRGVITTTGGKGRGNNSTFKKGDNFDTFFAIKGDKNDVFLGQEKTTKMSIKGDKNAPYINTAIYTAANAPAQAREQAFAIAAADGDLKKGSPRQKGKEDKMIQQMFDEFWTLFNADENFWSRKNRCEGIWNMLPPNYREAILNELRSGKKHRDNPLHYLQYYTPAAVKPEFPIFKNGDASIAEAMNDAMRGGRALAFVFAGAALHISEKFAYVFLEDAIANKLKVIRTIPSNAMEQVPDELKDEIK